MQEAGEPRPSPALPAESLLVCQQSLCQQRQLSQPCAGQAASQPASALQREAPPKQPILSAPCRPFHPHPPGGVLTVADLAAAEAVVKLALRAEVMGVEVVAAPPPSSGAAVITALLVLAGGAWVGG